MAQGPTEYQEAWFEGTALGESWEAGSCLTLLPIPESPFLVGTLRFLG